MKITVSSEEGLITITVSDGTNEISIAITPGQPPTFSTKPVAPGGKAVK